MTSEPPPTTQGMTLWIEAETVADIDDFCNVLVTLPDGRSWGLNVWSFDFFETARQHPELNASAELAFTYMHPPDLFVKDLTRPTLMAVLSDILSDGEAPGHWALVADDD